MGEAKYRGIRPTVVSLKTSRLKQESTGEGERWREQRDSQITKIKYKHREGFQEKQEFGVNIGKQGSMQP